MNTETATTSETIERTASKPKRAAKKAKIAKAAPKATAEKIKKANNLKPKSKSSRDDAGGTKKERAGFPINVND